MGRLHPTHVSSSVDPAARRAKRAFSTVSASAVGIELGVSVVIGALFGSWLDGKAGTGPWLMILFLVLGFAAGMRSLLRVMRKLDREDREDRAHRGGPPAAPTPEDRHG